MTEFSLRRYFLLIVAAAVLTLAEGCSEKAHNELPSAPSSVRAAAGACAPGVHELFSFVELPEPAPEHHPLPQTMSDRPDGAAIELRQPVR